MPGVCLGRQQTVTQPPGQGLLCFAWFEAAVPPSMLCSRALGLGGSLQRPGGLVGGNCCPPERSQLCPFPHLHLSDRWERELGKKEEEEQYFHFKHRDEGGGKESGLGHL